MVSNSPKVIRETNEHEALLALLSEDVRALVVSGDYYVVPGKKADRPWVRRSDNHRVVQGQSPAVPNSAETGKRTALKQTATYRDALEAFLPMFSEGDERKSFERLVDKVMWGIEGYPQEVKYPCPHPEVCPMGGKDHVKAFYAKPDLNVGFKMIELLAGRAAQTINQTVKTTSVNVELEHRTFDVRLYDMSKQTAEQRRDALIEAGVIEREWLEKIVDTKVVPNAD